MEEKSPSDFEKATLDQPEAGLLGEFWDFLRYSKKWWLLPLLVLLLALSALLLLSSSAAAPFIYTLF